MYMAQNIFHPFENSEIIWFLLISGLIMEKKMDKRWENSLKQRISFVISD